MCNLEAILDKQGRKKSWLARRIGVPNQTITKWVQQRTLPPINKALLIASLLDVPVTDIWPKEEL